MRGFAQLLLSTPLLLFAPQVTASDAALVASPGVTSVLTPGRAWLVGMEMSWGVSLGFELNGAARRMVVGDELGASVHARLLAGSAGDHGAALLMLGLEARLLFYRDPHTNIRVYRMASLLGALVPEAGLALDGRSPRPFLAWSLPFSFFKYDEVVPSLVWVSPHTDSVLLFALSVRLL
jgi:hypothetical protein